MYGIFRGFYRPFATGVACRQGMPLLRTPGPAHLGLAYILLIETGLFHEFVIVFPDYAPSIIRYFLDLALEVRLVVIEVGSYLYKYSFLISSAPLAQGGVTSCPANGTDRISWKFGNFCYLIVFRDMSWYDARKFCAVATGDLAEVRTKQIQESIVEHLENNTRGRNGFWMAANDNDSEGNWEWLHDLRMNSFWLFLFKFRNFIFRVF